MALGRAIVAPSTPNIREILKDGEARLFDPANPAAFRTAIEELCAEASLRARLGAAARSALHRQGLTWGNNARRIVQLFETVVWKSDRNALKESPADCAEKAANGPKV